MAEQTNFVNGTFKNSAEGRPNTDDKDDSTFSSTPPSSSSTPSPKFAINAKEMDVEKNIHKGEGEECAMKTTKCAG